METNERKDFYQKPKQLQGIESKEKNHITNFFYQYHQIYNLAKQRSGAGIKLFTTLAHSTKILHQINSEKTLITKQYILDQYYIINIIHHNQQNDLQFIQNFITISNEHEQNQFYIGTIINSDANLNSTKVRKLEYICNQEKIIKLNYEKNHKWKNIKNFLQVILFIKNKQQHNIKILSIEYQPSFNQLSDHAINKIIIQIQGINLQKEEIKRHSYFLNNKTTLQIQKEIRTLLHQQPTLVNQQMIINKLNKIKIIQNKCRNQTININSDNFYEEIKKLNKEIKEQILQKINNQQQNKWQQIITENRNRLFTNPKQYYKVYKRIFKIDSRSKIINYKQNPLFDKENNPIFSENEKETLMKDYFSSKYRSLQEEYEYIHINDNEIDNLINSYCPKLSYNKAPGEDGLLDIYWQGPKTAGPFKNSNSNDKNFKNLCYNTNLKAIIKYFIQDINNNYFSQYKLGRQIYIIKDENNRQLENCRPISILPLPIKIIEDIIYQNIINNPNIKQLNIRQTGFQAGKSTTLNIQKIIQLLKNTIKNKKHQYIIYYDFKSAFDTPIHDKMFKILIKRGFGESVVKWIRWIYTNIRINNYQINNGTLQGSKISPIIFIHYLEHVLEKVMRKTQLDLSNAFQFADDLSLINEDIQKLKQFDEQLKIYTKKYGLIINIKKTQIQLISNYRQKKVEILQNKIKQVFDYSITNQYKYLGFIIDNKVKATPNINKIKQKLGQFCIMMNNAKTRSMQLYDNYILWMVFIKAQFQYSISQIRSTSTETNWKSIQTIFNKTLKIALKLPNSISNNKIYETLLINDLNNIEENYRLHIINQDINNKQKNQLDNIQINLVQGKNKQLKSKMTKIILKNIDQTEKHQILKLMLSNQQQKIFMCRKCQKYESIQHISNHFQQNHILQYIQEFQKIDWLKLEDKMLQIKKNRNAGEIEEAQKEKQQIYQFLKNNYEHKYTQIFNLL